MNRMIEKSPFLFIISFLYSTLAGPALAQPSIIDQIIKTQHSLVGVRATNMGLVKSSGSAAALDPKTGRIVVTHNAAMAAYQRGGAGVIIHPSGIIVTNAHTVNKAGAVTVVFSDNTETSAQVIRVINNLDLALLKFKPSRAAIPVIIGDSNEIRLGDEIATIGNSDLLKESITGGQVIGLGTSRSKKTKGQTDHDLIQTSFNVYKGDSGGPLFDKQGRLIGLMTAKQNSVDHSSFAIPSNKIVTYLNEYLKNPSP